MTSPLRLDDQLCFALYAAERAMTRVYREALDPLGLTYPQYLGLLVLWETDNLSVSEIGDRLMLDSGTLTPLLKRLETQGFVSRTRDPHDERVVRVVLTTAGKALRARAECVPSQMFQQTGLSLKKLVTLRTELRSLATALGSPLRQRVD